MTITIDIEGKDYLFEMNRTVYKRLLADKEYAQMQNEVNKRLASKKNIETDENITELLLQNLIMQEQVFYYSLLTHQPDITSDDASKLLDKAYDEYGIEEVNNLVSTLIQNFTQREDQPKKKMVMKIS